MHESNILFVGGGNMARSLIGGLVADGCNPSRLTVADPNAEQREAIRSRFGVTTREDNSAALTGADVVVLAVKPQILREVATALAPATRGQGKLFVSIVAGIREPDLQRWLGGDSAIVRSMPNTPALLGSGVSALYANAHVSEIQRETAESILRAVGAVVWLDEEDLMDAVTAVSGSGPAYFFLFMEVIEQAARDLGLEPDVARMLTVETALGAARMALETGTDLAMLRRHVTSPGGTTAAALAVLDTPQMRDCVQDAIQAACVRSSELAREFGR